jgi:hypothetical protein
VSKTPGAAVLSPVALAALALLLVNDHVLKHAFPGVITGKLSDAAGLVFFPVLAWSLVEFVARTTLSRRAMLGFVVATGVYFALAKLWAPVAEPYRLLMSTLQWPARAIAALVDGHALPGVARVSFVHDVTDLVALPFLAVPAWLATRRSRS